MPLIDRAGRLAGLTTLLATAAACSDSPDLPPSGRDTVEVTPEQRQNGGRFAANLELRIGRAEGEHPDVFGQVRAVDADSIGRIYVLDFHDQEIRVFDEDGAYLRTIGRHGPGPGEMDNAWGLAIRNGRIWLVDFADPFRYTIFDLEGRLVDTHRRAFAGVALPWRGSVDSLGRLYDTGIRLRDNREGVQASRIVSTVFRVTPGGTHQSLLVVRDTAPMVNDEVQTPFKPRKTHYVDPAGYIWMANTSVYRVAQLTLNADTIRVISVDAPPVGITDHERDSVVAVYNRFMKKKMRPSDLPDRKPLIKRLYGDGEGRLLVELEVAQGASQQFDVFDTTGTYLGLLEIDTRLADDPALRFKGDLVYGVIRDSLDLPYVVRLRMTPAAGRQVR